MTTATPPLTEAQINDLRRRIDAGEQVSNEEIMAGLDAIRSARLNASTTTPKAAGGKAVSVAPMTFNLGDLLKKVHDKRAETPATPTVPAIEAPKP